MTGRRCVDVKATCGVCFFSLVAHTLQLNGRRSNRNKWGAIWLRALQVIVEKIDDIIPFCADVNARCLNKLSGQPFWSEQMRTNPWLNLVFQVKVYSL